MKSDNRPDTLAAKQDNMQNALDAVKKLSILMVVRNQTNEFGVIKNLPIGRVLLKTMHK